MHLSHPEILSLIEYQFQPINYIHTRIFHKQKQQHQTKMVHDPRFVGREFVRQYNLILNRSPENLYRFYRNSAKFDHDAIGTKVRQTISASGRHGIRDVMKERMAKHRHQCTIVHSVDTFASVKDGLIVQVIGEISFDEAPLRSFSQTFMLVAHSPFQYFVVNDIFHYTDYRDDADECNNQMNDGNQLSDSSFMDEPECDRIEEAVIDMQTMNLKGMVLKEDSHPLTRDSLMQRVSPATTHPVESRISWSDEMEACEHEKSDSHDQMFQDKCILTIGYKINPNIEFDDARDSCGTPSIAQSNQAEYGNYEDDNPCYGGKYEDSGHSPFIDVVGYDDYGAQYYTDVEDPAEPGYEYPSELIYENTMQLKMESQPSIELSVEDDECSQYTQQTNSSVRQCSVSPIQTIVHSPHAKRVRPAQRKKQARLHRTANVSGHNEVYTKVEEPVQPKAYVPKQPKEDSPKQPKEESPEQPEADSSIQPRENSPALPKTDKPKRKAKPVDTADKATETEFTPKSVKSSGRKSSRVKIDAEQPPQSPEVHMTSTAVQCDSPEIKTDSATATFAELLKNKQSDEDERVQVEVIAPLQSRRNSSPFTTHEKSRGSSFRNDRDKFSRCKYSSYFG